MARPTEYVTEGQCDLMAILAAERKAQGIHLNDLEEKSGVSVNSFYAWRKLVRSPQMHLLVAVAETLGFDVFVIRAEPKASIKINNIMDGCASLESAIAVTGRKQLGMSGKSGVSSNSLWAWRTGIRSPQFSCFLKVLRAFDFKVALRRKDADA